MFCRWTIVAGAALVSIGCNAGGELQREHEISALLQIKTIARAETQYYSQFNRYAASLGELGPPANLISKELASGKLSGYIFTLQSMPEGYAVTAVPETPESGTRTFYSDQMLVIRNERDGGRAGAASPEVK